MNNKVFLWLILVMFLALAFLFYWFELRPSQIRSECDQIAWNKAKESNTTKAYDWKYTQCLHNKGLK